MKLFILILAILLPFSSIIAQEADLEISARNGEGYFTTSDSARLHYLYAGKGEAIIFIPGWLMPAEIWENQIDFFSKSYFVVALDPRCQGKSSQTTEGLTFDREATDIKELTGHLHLNSFYLVGWSWAGATLYSYLNRYNDPSLKGVVLVDSPLKINEALLNLQSSRINGFLHDRVVANDKFVRGMYMQPHSEAYLKKVITASWITPTTSAITMLSNFFVSRDSTWISALRNAGKPLLYIGTETKSDLLMEITKSVNIDYDLIPGAGHAIFVDKADRFNNILLKFITK